MARNAAVRSRRGHGDWIGQTDIWSDPRAQIDTPAPAPAAVPARNTISDAQRKFLKSLIDSRKASDNEGTRLVAEAVRTTSNSLHKDGKLSVAVASQLIAALKGLS